MLGLVVGHPLSMAFGVGLLVGRVLALVKAVMLVVIKSSLVINNKR
jgi:hypothetical protein